MLVGTVERELPTKNLSPEIMAHASAASGVAFQLRRDPKGVLEVPGFKNVLVSIHLGPPAQVSCRRGGKQYRGRAVHGDIDIIPGSTPTRWEMHDEHDTALLLSLPTSFLRVVAQDCGLDETKIDVLDRFQVRDSTLESLSWAIKQEMELGCPSGRLYLDGLALSFASRLLTRHTSLAPGTVQSTPELNGHRLKRVLAFIEEEISGELSVEEISAVAGVGPSHLQTLFRKATGISVHRYVIQRRVERAKELLRNHEMPLSDIAQAVGFSDQSHLSRHMRKLLNVSPSSLRQHR